jgi:hypothetical protein
MNILDGALAILKYFGFDDPTQAGGWIVAVFVSAFMVWRINIADKKFDENTDKITKIIEKQEEEWRRLINKTDDMMFEILESSTKNMTVLAEKINTLQALLLQGQNKR